MTPHRLDPVLRHVRGVGGTPDDGQPDAALLAAFNATGDQASFAALVRRHGSMVLGVRRRLIVDAHAAEDAFQATFLGVSDKGPPTEAPGAARPVAVRRRPAGGAEGPDRRIPAAGGGRRGRARSAVIQRGGKAPAGIRHFRIPLRARPDQPPPFKPDDVILKTGDVIVVDLARENLSRPPTATEPDRPTSTSTAGPAAATLAVAAPDGKILVQMPGRSWKLFDAAKLSATDTVGGHQHGGHRPEPVGDRGDRLADGQSPAAPYLQLVKPGALDLTVKD